MFSVFSHFLSRFGPRFEQQGFSDLSGIIRFAAGGLLEFFEKKTVSTLSS